MDCGRESNKEIEKRIKGTVQKYLKETMPASWDLSYRAFIEPLNMTLNEKEELEISCSHVPNPGPLMHYIKAKYGEAICRECHPRKVVYNMEKTLRNDSRYPQEEQPEKKRICYSKKAELVPFSFINGENEDIETKRNLISRLVLTYICLEVFGIETMPIMENSIPEKEIIPYLKALATERENVINEDLLVMLNAFLEKNPGQAYETLASALYESLVDKEWLCSFAEEVNVNAYFFELKYQLKKATARKVLKNFLQTTMEKQSIEIELDEIYEQITAQEDPNDDAAWTRMEDFIYELSLRPSIEATKALIDILEMYDVRSAYETLLEDGYAKYLSTEEKAWVQMRYEEKFEDTFE